MDKLKTCEIHTSPITRELISALIASLLGTTLRPLIVGGLIKKRGLVIFPEEINGEGVNKWKWVDFDMQCGNKGGCQ